MRLGKLIVRLLNLKVICVDLFHNLASMIQRNRWYNFVNSGLMSDHFRICVFFLYFGVACIMSYSCSLYQVFVGYDTRDTSIALSNLVVNGAQCITNAVVCNLGLVTTPIVWHSYVRHWQVLLF